MLIRKVHIHIKESLVINKKINLTSNGNVTIQAKNSYSSVVNICKTGFGSSIQNFKLTNTNYCIIINANNCTVSNNIINSASLVGIQFYGDISHAKVIGNRIVGLSSAKGNGISFEFGTSSDNIIYGNKINNFLNGILFNSFSEYNRVSYNKIYCTGACGAGTYFTVTHFRIQSDS